MTYKLLPLTLTLLLAFPNIASASYFPHEEIRPYQPPTVVKKERIKTPNNCYTYIERDFTERRYCEPDRFFLHLSNGEIRQVSEMEYNRNKVGQPLTR